MSDVLLTGGNGFVGRHVVSALRGRGDRVRVLALPGEDTGWLSGRDVTVVLGDIRDPRAVGAAVSGMDGVIHLAAMMDVWRPLSDYRAVNVTGTLNVCRAALRADVGRVVHMSSTSVYGRVVGRVATEEDQLRPFRDPYPLSKAEADIAVQRMIAEQALPAVVVRPDQIFGPGDEMHFARTADRLRQGRGVIVGPGDNAVPMVFVSDLVRGLLLALDHPGATGQVYNITHDRPLTQRAFLNAIALAIGADPPRRRVPYSALYAAGGLCEHLAAISPGARRPPVTRLGVQFIGTNQRHSVAKACRELGFEPRTPLEVGVQRAAEWYLAHTGVSVSRARPAVAPGRRV